MKKTTLVGALALGLLSTSAFAADLPSRKMAPAAPVTYAPAFAWTGFYVGANAGYGFGQISKAGTLFNDPAGFVGGGQIGYNYQMNNIVFGLEGDLQYADLRDKASPAGVRRPAGRHEERRRVVRHDPSPRRSRGRPRPLLRDGRSGVRTAEADHPGRRQRRQRELWLDRRRWRRVRLHQQLDRQGRGFST